MIRITTFDVRALRRSLAAGIVVAVALLIGGSVFALSQQQSWTAESVVVVLPAASLDEATSAAYYETLSRGQIVATFAEVAGNGRFEQQAEEQLGLSERQRQAVSTEVSVVPGTAVILIRATAAEADTAERVADTITAMSAQYWSGLSDPYRTQTVGSAAGSAYSSGTSPLVLLGAMLGVALIAGLAVQQAIYHLAVSVRRTRLPDPERDVALTCAGGDT